MLVLSRRLNETILIDGGIEITVVGFRGNQVRLGIKAPDEVGIYREELRNYTRVEKNGETHSMAEPVLAHALFPPDAIAAVSGV